MSKISNDRARDIVFALCRSFYTVAVALRARRCWRVPCLSFLFVLACPIFVCSYLHLHAVGHVHHLPSIPIEIAPETVDSSAGTDWRRPFVKSNSGSVLCEMRNRKGGEKGSYGNLACLPSEERRVSLSRADLPFAILHSALHSGHWSLRLLLFAPIEAREIRGIDLRAFLPN